MTDLLSGMALCEKSFVVLVGLVMQMLDDFLQTLNSLKILHFMAKIKT